MTETYTTDAFLGEKLHIQQPTKGFRSGSDAVFLAASLPATATGSVLDVGCGAGVASLCVAHRLPHIQVTGLDCEESLITLAQDNALKNHLQDRVSFIPHDIQNPLEHPLPQSFDRVFSNPPYFKDSTHSDNSSRTQSRHYGAAAFLKTWVNFCLKMTKPRGYVHFIFPSANLQHLLACLPLPALGELTLFPLWPKEDALASKRMILIVRKGVSSPSIIHQGLILHHSDGTYTPHAHDILWNGNGIKI